ncbi:MAG: trehalose-6-phosphate synthase [Deltaproteobacteria bacterium]|nr:trehalose-6-phosphate synthase [Deltaproteobacteria bacterium]
MSDLVIVSNRGPFQFSNRFIADAETCLAEGTHPESPKFGEGGLVQAMAGLLKPGKWRTTWIGASMGDQDIDVARGHYKNLFRNMHEKGHAPEHFPLIEIEEDTRMHFRYREYDFYMRFVFFDTKHMRSYYSKFANGFLWPLMHLTRSPLFYKKSRVFPRPHFEKTDFVQYTSSGVTFANTIVDEIHKSDDFLHNGNDIVVWNQDYHLMQISEAYRAILHEQGFSEAESRRLHSGQFMHTPFFNIHEIQGLIREDKRCRIKATINDPFAESIESVLQKLVWGMLANDFIGFHTKEYCDHYLEALEEWFPVKIRMAGNHYEIIHHEAITTVGALPIGLDVDRILSEVTEKKHLEHVQDGESIYEKIQYDKSKGFFIFGGLERCDYTKGMLERIGIFTNALNRLHEAGQEARLYQVTSPSRTSNPDYQKLMATMEKEVTNTNNRLGNQAIEYISSGIPAPQNYRFMKEIHVMLVTPLDDGMNLVAFEYILSQKFNLPEDRGILVLSTSGASRVLKEKGFRESDGIIYVNPMLPKNAGERIVDALRKGYRLSDRVIDYVITERRIDDWAEENIQAILNSRKSK